MAKPRWIKQQPFAGQSVMITGGSQGMGLAVAKDVVRLGGSVCVVAIDGLAEAQSEIEPLRTDGNQFVDTLLCDTADRDRLKPLVKAYIDRRGVPDSLFNFVGYAYAQYAKNLKLDDFKQNMAVNYYGQLVPTLALLPCFLRRKTGGHISFTSSILGYCGIMGYATYAPTKHALVGLAEVLRNELKPHGIRISILYPPDTRTPGFAKENETKPPECAVLSEKAKLLEPEAVAETFIQGILRNQFQILPGKASLYWRLSRYVPGLFRGLMDWEYAKARKKVGKGKKTNGRRFDMARAAKRQWSDCLSVQDGQLYIEGCNTLDLVTAFGSPLFVLSEQQLRDNVREFKRAFSQAWPHGEVDVLPALKANSTLASRKILSDEGAGADIYSEGELIGALACGTQPELISVNGGGKSEAVIRRCIEAGVRITVEDLDEPELINRVAQAMGKTAKIRFRVKPDFPNLHRRTDFSPEYVSIDLGIQVYKSGIPAQYLPELGKKVLGLDHVELVGLHFHGGRHHQSLWYWRGLMTQYAALVADLCEIWGQNGHALKLEELDIGGGYASHRDPLNRLELGKDVIFTWLTWPIIQAMRLLPPMYRYRLYSLLVKAMARDPYPGYAPSIHDYAQAAAGTFRRELEKRHVDLTGVRLQIEPGRGLYGNTGIHLTTVKKVKKQTQPMRMTWVLTDTTYFFLAGGTYEYNFHDFVVANRVNDKACQVADIVGHSCYADRILPLVNIPDVQEKDVIAILETGAYQEVSASNFNALPRPATVLVNHDSAEIIKRGETVEDVFARDVIPKRLNKEDPHEKN